MYVYSVENWYEVTGVVNGRIVIQAMTRTDPVYACNGGVRVKDIVGTLPAYVAPAP